jgi:hypothetical protein
MCFAQDLLRSCQQQIANRFFDGQLRHKLLCHDQLHTNSGGGRAGTYRTGLIEGTYRDSHYGNSSRYKTKNL